MHYKLHTSTISHRNESIIQAFKRGKFVHSVYKIMILINASPAVEIVYVGNPPLAHAG